MIHIKFKLFGILAIQLYINLGLINFWKLSFDEMNEIICEGQKYQDKNESFESKLNSLFSFLHTCYEDTLSH